MTFYLLIGLLVTVALAKGIDEAHFTKWNGDDWFAYVVVFLLWPAVLGFLFVGVVVAFWKNPQEPDLVLEEWRVACLRMLEEDEREIEAERKE